MDHLWALRMGAEGSGTYIANQSTCNDLSEDYHARLDTNKTAVREL